MIDQTAIFESGTLMMDFDHNMIDVVDAWGYTGDDPLLIRGETFTRSNGSIVARVYERLTKASRRRSSPSTLTYVEGQALYRKGVYDAFKALQEELA